MNDIHALDLNLFLALDSLLREKSVTRAAESLGVTQSAMSHRLKNLRRLFDDPLLVRGEEGYLLTPTAQRLEPYVNRGLTEFRLALENKNRFDPATSNRTFYLLTYDYVDHLIVPHLLSLIQQTAPNVRLIVRPLLQAQWARALEQGEADLAVGVYFPDSHVLKKRRLLEDNFLTAIGPKHPFEDAIMDLESYLSWPHALITISGQGESAVGTALKALGRERTVLVKIASFLAAPMLLLQSNLILTAPKLLLRSLSQTLPLRLFEPPVSLNNWPLNMVWHERFQADAAHIWLRQQIITATKQAQRPLSD